MMIRDVLFTQPPARATKLLVPTPQGRQLCNDNSHTLTLTKLSHFSMHFATWLLISGRTFMIVGKVMQFCFKSSDYAKLPIRT